MEIRSVAAVLATIGVAGCTPPPPAADLPAQAAGSAQASVSPASVSLSRGPCYGTCPVYSLSIDEAGAVVFDGERHVRVVGRANASVPADSAAALLADLDRAGFSAMADRYVFGEAACGRYMSDLPTITVTHARAGVSKRVEYDQGCTGGPAALAELARRIDEVAGSARYIQ